MKILLTSALFACVTLASVAAWANPSPQDVNSQEMAYLCTVRVQSGVLNVRDKPGGRVIGALHRDEIVGAVRGATDRSGAVWYRVTGDHGQIVGWVASVGVRCQDYARS